MKMTKKEKIKQFVQEHQVEIFYTTVTTAAIGLYAFAVANAKHGAEKANELAREAVKARNAWADSENKWLDEQEANGNAIYLLQDWTYLLVPKDSPREWIKDRPKQP